MAIEETNVRDTQQSLQRKTSRMHKISLIELHYDAAFRRLLLINHKFNVYTAGFVASIE